MRSKQIADCWRCRSICAAFHKETTQPKHEISVISQPGLCRLQAINMQWIFQLEKFVTNVWQQRHMMSCTSGDILGDAQFYSVTKNVSNHLTAHISKAGNREETIKMNKLLYTHISGGATQLTKITRGVKSAFCLRRVTQHICQLEDRKRVCSSSEVPISILLSVSFQISFTDSCSHYNNVSQSDQ